jgi:hypothetical protein
MIVLVALAHLDSFGGFGEAHCHAGVHQVVQMEWYFALTVSFEHLDGRRVSVEGLSSMGQCCLA